MSDRDKDFNEAVEAFEKLDNNRWLRALDRYFYTEGFGDGKKAGENQRPPLPVWVVLSWLILVPFSCFLGVLFWNWLFWSTTVIQ